VPNRLKRGILNVIASDSEGTIPLGDGAQFAYQLKDPNWAHSSKNIRGYEPELWYIADRFFTPDTILVDCGANAGLWSSYASARIGNPDQIIAVEPGDGILPILHKNQELNGNGFTVLENAIWHKSGEELQFHVQENHVSSSLVADEERTPMRRIPVQTVCVDDIVEKASAKAPEAKNVIIKLDVEGVEIEALKGAQRTVENKNALIVYEDHGKDPTSKVTEYFLEQGLHVYYLDAHAFGTQAQAITDKEQLTSIKTQPKVGYNFIACKPGSAFDKEFEQLCQESQQSSEHTTNILAEQKAPVHKSLA